MEPNVYDYKPAKFLVTKPPSCVTIIMSASIRQRPLQLAEPKRRSAGVEPKRTGLKRGALTKVIETLAEHLEPPDTPEESASEQRTSVFEQPHRLLGLSPCPAARTTDRIGIDRVWAQARAAGSAEERGCLAEQQCRASRKSPRPPR